MNQKERKIKLGIIIFLAAAFCASVFLIAAGKYGLWESWSPKEEKEQALEILTSDAKWRHLGTKSEPGVGNVWTTQEYDADDWEQVSGRYEEDCLETGTTTAFFRYEFNVEDTGKYQYMEGKIQYADAVLIYLNGNVIFAGNVPAGGYYSNLNMGACNAVETTRESTFAVTDLEGLTEGRNVIAVEVHRRDESSQNIAFHFQQLNMFETEYEEETPDTEGLMLCRGEESDTVEMNWITDLEESYKIEYMEGTLDTVEESTFSEYAHSVIMDSKESSNGTGYQKSGQITRLKERTDYVYRVIRIGGVEGSAIYQFRTAEKQETSFLYTGNVRMSGLGEALHVRNWKSNLKKAVDFSDRPDYLIVGKTEEEWPDTAQTTDKNHEKLFRAAEELKEIPVIVSESFKGDAENGKPERQSRAYMDLLLMSLSTADRDYDGIRNYMESAMLERNRKWNMVIIDASYLTEQGTIEAQYSDIFEELDIDLVLVSGGEYGIQFTGGGDADSSEGNYVKDSGQTLYVYGGMDAVAIQVASSEIGIKGYDVEAGTTEKPIKLRRR